MAHTSSLRLLVLHALRIKGLAEADAVVTMMGTDADATGDELIALEDQDLVSYRHGRMPGYKLTPEGRVVGERLLHEELDETGTRPAIAQAYEDFLPRNDELLDVCTAWQLRPVDGEQRPNDHRDPEYDRGVVERLVTVHDEVEPVLATLEETLARFGGHRVRLRTALDHVQAGDHDWFTKPMSPSYHSTWFELHEDLLATLGTERAPGRKS